MADISILDWLLLAVLLISAGLGALRGLVYEVLSVLSWVVAFVFAQWLAASVGAQLPLNTDNEMARYASGFAATFIGTLLVCGLVTALIKKFISAVGLRPVDRALGVFFGLLRGILLLLFLAVVLSRTPLTKLPIWQESTGVGMLSRAATVVIPMLPPDVLRYLPE
jgi:membrane protein required for colicin V production